jgi:hypothetical protein
MRPMSASDPGRNSPCPCGSGRKYKRCCGAPGGPLDAAKELHAIDEALFPRILRFGESEFAAAIREAAEACPFDLYHEPNVSIGAAYLLHMTRAGDGTLAEAFLRSEGARLTPGEREWLDACLRSWQSVWEVIDVFPERGLELRDLLTGEQRGVAERSATKGLRPGLAICARVVDAKGVAVLAGCHPRPLDPLTVDGIVSEWRRIVRTKKVPIPAEKLRGEFCRTLLGLWEDAVDRLDRRPPPRLENTDGDPLQDTLDRFSLEAASRQLVEAALGALEGLGIESLPDVDGAAATIFRAVRDGSSVAGMDNVTVGTIEIDASEVCARTNSERRADDLRSRIEAACAGLLVHTGRERRDMQDMLASASGRGTADMEATTPPESGEHDALILEFKRRHYAAWPDEPVPALGGLTPREAARRSEARRRLVALLKEFEMNETREPESRRFDVEDLRRELGIVHE